MNCRSIFCLLLLLILTGCGPSQSEQKQAGPKNPPKVAPADPQSKENSPRELPQEIETGPQSSGENIDKPTPPAEETVEKFTAVAPPRVRTEADTNRTLLVVSAPELSEHKEGVSDVAFSADGRFVATIGGDQKLKISDAKTGELKRDIKIAAQGDQRLSLNSVAFAPDRQLVAVATSQEIRLFHPETGEAIQTISREQAGGKFARFTSDGKRLVVLRSRSITVWTMPEGKLEREIPTSGFISESFALAPAGNFLAIEGKEKSIDLFDLSSGEVAHRFEGSHEESVKHVAINSDGSLMAAIDYGDRFVVYDFNTRQERFRKEGVNCSALAFSPDGLLAIGFYGVPLYLVGEKELHKVGYCGLRGVTAAGSLQFSPDGLRLIGTDQSHQHRADLFTFDWSREEQTIATLERSVSSMAASADGNWLAWADQTSLVLYSLKENKIAAQVEFENTQSPERKLDFSPDGEYLAVRVGPEYGAVLELYSTPKLEKRTTWKPEFGQFGAMRFTPDGKSIAMFIEDVCQLWNVEKGEVSEGPQLQLRLAQFQGEQIVGVSAENNIGVYKWPGGEEVKTWQVAGEITQLAVSSDGARAATCSKGEKKASLWNLKSGELDTAVEESEEIIDIAFSSDGKWLLTVGRGKRLNIYASENGELRASVPGHSRFPQEIVTAAGSSLFYTAGDEEKEQSIKQWDLAKLLDAVPPPPPPEEKPEPPITTGIPLADFGSGGNEPAGFAGGGIYLYDSERVKFYDSASLEKRWSQDVGDANWATLSPNGRWLAASFGDDTQALGNNNAVPGTVKLWDMKNQRYYKTLTLATSVPERMSFSPDSTMLAVASGNIGLDGLGELSLWNVEEAKRIHSFAVENRRVTHVQFSADGNLLAAGGFDDHVTVWEVKSKKQLYRHRLEYQMDDLQFSPNGKLLGVCGGDFKNGKIDIYTAATGKRMPLFDDFQEETTTLAFSPAGDILIAACSNDRREMGYRIWSLPEGKMIRRLLPASPRWGWGSIFFTPDGSRFGENAFNSLRLWDYESLLNEPYQRQLISLKDQKINVQFKNGRLNLSFYSVEATDELLKNLPVLKHPFALDLDTNAESVTDAGLGHLAKQENLKELSLASCTEVTSKGLEQLAGIPLSALNITRTKLNNTAGVAVIGEIETLESLTTYSLGSSEEPLDLSPLANLTKLKSLTLRSFSGSGDSLAPLAKLTQLKHFQLSGYGLADEDCKHLAPLKNLRELIVDGGSKFSGAGLAQLTCENLETLELDASLETEEAVAAVGRFKQLRRLLLSGVENADQALAAAAGLIQLEEINLPGTISDAGLVHLAELTKLKQLSLSGHNITDAGLSKLEKLDAVESLYLGDNEGITGSGLAAFAGAEKLVYLDLSRLPGLTAAGLGGVAKITSLTELELPPNTNDEGLSNLAGLDQLRVLRLEEVKITDAGIAHLEKLPNLEKLILENTSLTDAALPHLAKLKKLTYLEISGTGITQEGKENLKKSFPDLQGLIIFGP